MNKTACFMAGYNAFPFGSKETLNPERPEYRGWSTRCRESMRKPAERNGERPLHAPYKPRLSGSDAAVLTIIRFLGA